MWTLDTQSRVRAPIETVWEFYSGIEGLETLTPSVFGLRVRSPVDRGDLDTLTAGTTLELSVQPLGIGPRVTLTTTITDRYVGDAVCWFVDTPSRWPFDEVRHQHCFYADGGTTIVRDRLTFGLVSPLGRLEPIVYAGLLLLFRYRHWKTDRECTQ